MKPVILVAGEKEAGKDAFADRLAKHLTRILACGEGAAAPRPLSSSTSTPAGGTSQPAVIQRLAFADPIKRAIGEIMGIPDEVLWGNSETKETHFVYGRSVRQYLQWYGTEVFRDGTHAAIWCHKALRGITGCSNDRYVQTSARGWCLADCRFGNEFSVMRDVLERGAPLPIMAGPVSLVRANPRGEEDRIEATRIVPPGRYKTFLYQVRRKNRPTAGADSHRSEQSFHELEQYWPVQIDNSGTLEALDVLAEKEAARIAAVLRAS